MGKTGFNHTLVWRMLFSFTVVIFLQPFIGNAVFAAGADLSITFDEDLIYCNASYTGNAEHIAQVLNEGTEVTLVWNIDVYGIREYWLNKGVGGVTVSHSVVPDLVSRKWHLIDRTSGISRFVDSLQDAISFLTQLERFPVIDRSLLEKGQQYRLRFTLEEHLGFVEEGWFSRWWGYEKTKYNLDFTNP